MGIKSNPKSLGVPGTSNSCFPIQEFFSTKTLRQKYKHKMRIKTHRKRMK